MKDVLETIVAHKRQEIDEWRRFLPLKQLYGIIEFEGRDKRPQPSFRRSLTESTTGIIAEFKRRSPSKGWIKQEGKADVIPLSYQQNGAAAVSILTDREFFGGYDEFVQEARLSGVSLPILYKNFIIDEYQLFQAKHAGASAVLLIAAVLEKENCGMLMRLAHDLGMEVLLEMHTEEELDYAMLEPDVCGINNRNLGTFVTDVQNSYRLAELLPKDAVKVSESGISHPETVRELRAAGFNGFLMGECFMKAADPGQALHDFIAQL
ncbi:MAG: indole-3-glycerol phosphate synthase TrpC [Prevotella sp.]|nr:indole-3-glycerol phosphate synthase TrpC [Prevotella sp.]